MSEWLKAFTKGCEAALTGALDEDAECEQGGNAALIVNAGITMVVAISSGTIFKCIGTSRTVAISVAVVIAAITTSVVSAVQLG